MSFYRGSVKGGPWTGPYSGPWTRSKGGSMNRESVFSGHPELSAFNEVVQWIETFIFSSKAIRRALVEIPLKQILRALILFFFFTLFYLCGAYSYSNIMRQIQSKIYRNIKNAICIIAYLPVFIVILDTVTITQFERRIPHVPNLIREVTALRCDV